MRNLLEVGLMRVMKGSNCLFQKTRVPPCALFVVRAISGSNMSSELSEHL